MCVTLLLPVDRIWTAKDTHIIVWMREPRTRVSVRRQSESSMLSTRSAVYVAAYGISSQPATHTAHQEQHHNTSAIRARLLNSGRSFLFDYYFMSAKERLRKN